MAFRLLFTPEADENLDELERDRSKAAQLNAVNKTLGFLETNPRHPSLQSKTYRGLKAPGGQALFESYAQQHTPGAFRVFWYYGPEKGKITITSITPHP